MKLIHIVLSLGVTCHVFASETGVGSGRKTTSLETLHEDPIARRDKAQMFESVVSAGIEYAAVDVYNDCNPELGVYCIKYCIKNERSNLLIRLFQSNTHKDKTWPLKTLLLYANMYLLSMIFRKIVFPKWILTQVAGDEDVVCIPEMHTFLLENNTDQAGRASAIIDGITVLFRKRKTEHLYPLLSALERATFLSQNLKDIAIHTTFWEGSCHDKDTEVWAQRFFNHFAITAAKYSDALYLTYGKSDQGLFNWLLKNADHKDLQQVIADERFLKMGTEFCGAVNLAKSKVGLDTRHAILLRKNLDAILVTFLSEHLTNIFSKLIAEYTY